MRTGRPKIISSAAVLLIGTIGAAALFWHLGYWKLVLGPKSVSNERIWNAVSCRIRSYRQMARADVPELSWSELWRLMVPGRGFHCTEGSSLAASLEYSSSASQADRLAGARICRERCTGCHGIDGSSGPVAATAGPPARPGISGGANWQNLAFDPIRASEFVPATESSVFTKLPPNRVVGGQKGLFTGNGWSQSGTISRKVLALDAATGQQKWAYTSPSSTGNNHSGLLAREGGLVFGASGGVCFALDADTGREAWSVPLGGNIKSPPISFTVVGRQVIAIAAGRACESPNTTDQARRL
jgi:hypothetical protein